MDQYAAEALIAFGAVAAVALTAGLVRPWAPLVTTAVRLALPVAFVGLLVVASVWVADCPGCESFNSYDSPRAIDLIMAILWGGTFTVALLGLTWLGSSISTLARRGP